MTLSERTKKILQITLFILAVFALGYLLYVVFFQRAAPPAVDGNINGVTGLPEVNLAPENANGAVNTNQPREIPRVSPVASGDLTQTTSLTPDKFTKDPSLAANGLLRYYLPEDGKFYRVDGNGNITQLGAAQFKSVEKVNWAPTSNEAILEFPDGANIYYDFDTGRQVTLPNEYEEFTFSPTSDQIAFKYMHMDPERRVLAVANPDGSSARTVESLGYHEDRVNVNWSPTGKVIATWGEYIDLNRQELGFIGLNDENFKGTIVEGRGIKSQYSTDGKELLYSVYSQYTDYNPTLWLVQADGDEIGNNRQDLAIQTSADKCTFSADSRYAYCGVPVDPPVGFGVAPEFLKDIPDDIYRIDVNTGAKTRLAVPVNENGEAKYAVEQISVSNDGSALYFQDTKTGQLIKIDLK